MKEYGEYQLNVIEEEKQDVINGGSPVNGYHPTSTSTRKVLKFGTNCDLSDNVK